MRVRRRFVACGECKGLREDHLISEDERDDESLSPMESVSSRPCAGGAVLLWDGRGGGVELSSVQMESQPAVYAKISEAMIVVAVRD